MSCHPTESGSAVGTATRHFALVGSPNSGKTTLFNALTGLRAKTGNYPGVTVSRYAGTSRWRGHEAVIEDLPGTYSLDPISPDEEIVDQVLDHDLDSPVSPNGILVTVDATVLRRGLGFLAQVLHVGLPTLVVVTFGDDLARRGGNVDLVALEKALGVPVIPVTAGDRSGVSTLQDHLVDPSSWPQPPVPPPVDPDEVLGWITSVLTAAHWKAPSVDARTSRIDRVLIHPVWGSLIFFAVMFTFFQMIFTVAAPLQGFVEEFFGWLGGLVDRYVTIEWLGRFLNEAVIGGVGGVLVFIPQIALLFLMIAFLEGTGYMSRAAFLMDRLMARAGLEGRAFVALLSSVACAVPGIMATRSLPSARDRLATIMAAPLMTCSARLPVYVMLVAMLVPTDQRVGPIGAQGLTMFALYLGGAIAAMTVAWFWSRIIGRRSTRLPFYMEMPSYRMPKARAVASAVWMSCSAFLRKVGTVILLSTLVLWGLLNLPLHSTEEMAAAGVNTSDDAAVTEYRLDHSIAAGIGRAAEPVFSPLGFDWRVNIAVISSLAAREVFVSTMGQLAAAEDPEDPGAALAQMEHTDGPLVGQPVFTPPTIAAMLVFFMFALQCMATVGAIRRETGTWKWPLIAFGYLGVLGWLLAFGAHQAVAALTS